MSSGNRNDRPALIVLGLLVLSIIFVSLIGLTARHEAEHKGRCAYDAPPHQSQVYEQDAICPDDHIFFGDGYAQWLMTIFAGVATGTGVLGVFWLKQTLDANTAMAGQAKRANEIALQSVEAQHRPWLDVEVTDVEHIITSSRLITGSFSIKVTNLSDYPAVAVHVWADLYSSNAGLLAGGREAETLVRHIEATFGTGMRGYIIFPNDYIERGFRGLTAKTFSNIVGHEMPDDISLSLVVGVIYKSAVGTQWHHTAHTFHVSTDTQHTFRFRDATHDSDTLTLQQLPGNSLIT